MTPMMSHPESMRIEVSALTTNAWHVYSEDRGKIAERVDDDGDDEAVERALIRLLVD